MRSAGSACVFERRCACGDRDAALRKCIGIAGSKENVWTASEWIRSAGLQWKAGDDGKNGIAEGCLGCGERAAAGVGSGRASWGAGCSGHAARCGYVLARGENCEAATGLEWGEGEVVVVVLTSDDSPMHLVACGTTRVERSIGANGKVERMIRRFDFDDGAGALGNDCVGIGARGVGAAPKNDGLGKKLETEAGGSSEDAVHADPGWRRSTFVTAKHGFQQIGLHRLDACARTLRGEVQRGTSNPARSKVGVAVVDVALYAVARCIVEIAVLVLLCRSCSCGSTDISRSVDTINDNGAGPGN